MIYVCIVSLQRDQMLSRCLHSIAAAVQAAGARTLVLKQLAACSDVRHAALSDGDYWLSPHNLGCAGGRAFLVDQLLTQGLKDYDITVWLDDDLVATDDGWLDALIAPIRAGHADIAGVDVRIVGEDGHTHPTDGEPDYASGGWCAIAGRVFRSGVRFDPAFFPNYWEDVDIGFQARAGGFRIARADGVGLKHDDHPANMAHYERTRSLFAQKWGQTWRE